MAATVLKKTVTRPRVVPYADVGPYPRHVPKQRIAVIQTQLHRTTALRGPRSHFLQQLNLTSGDAVADLRGSTLEGDGAMRTVDVRVAAQSLGRLVDQVRDSGESVMLSTPGGAKAILMPVDEFDSLQETLHALMQPGLVEELAQAERDYAAGRTISGEELRVRYGLPDRQRKRRASRDKGQP